MTTDEKKINENEVIEETTVIEGEVVEEKTGRFNKVKSFTKKHGKKILGGIVGVVALGAAYALGAKSGEDDDIIDADYYEFVPVGETEVSDIEAE